MPRILMLDQLVVQHFICLNVTFTHHGEVVFTYQENIDEYERVGM